MIVFSDNEAADAIYAQVGDAGMSEAARHAGMRDFAPTPGYWGGAQITAADLARFYFRLDRSLAGPDGAWARRLLASVTPSQRWGIPAAAGPRWRLWFKGGWRPPDERENSGPVTHQGALLEDRAGRRIGLAILTELSPYPDGIAMLRRIAGAMLAKRPPPSPEG